MKKFVLILLLLVLPLQMSWAAASAYCQHEQGNHAWHLGHHVHQHKASADSAGQQDSGKVHSDCSACHGASHGQAAFAGGASPAGVRAGALAVAPAPQFYTSHIPDGPKRPDWSTVA